MSHSQTSEANQVSAIMNVRLVAQNVIVGALIWACCPCATASTEGVWSVEGVLKQLDIKPLDIPDKGFALRWIVRSAFSRPKCVTIHATEQTVTVQLTQYEMSFDSAWGKKIFQGQVSDPSLLDSKILGALCTSPEFWKPLSPVETTLVESGTDGPNWWFELAQATGSRRSLAVGDLRILKGIPGVRKVELYFEVEEVLKDALIQAGILGWERDRSK